MTARTMQSSPTAQAETPVELVVNGKRHRVKSSADTPLLYVLRDELQFDGPKFGCGLSQCGACTVHVGDTAMRSCILPVGKVSGPVTTIEGLAEQSHPLVDSFIRHQAAQCGYCIPGMMMSAAALLKRKPAATRPDIVAALRGNLCRCGTHLRILAAVEDVAGGGKAS